MEHVGLYNALHGGGMGDATAALGPAVTVIEYAACMYMYTAR